MANYEFAIVSRKGTPQGGPTATRAVYRHCGEHLKNSTGTMIAEWVHGPSAVCAWGEYTPATHWLAVLVLRDYAERYGVEVSGFVQIFGFTFASTLAKAGPGPLVISDHEIGCGYGLKLAENMTR